MGRRNRANKKKSTTRQSAAHGRDASPPTPAPSAKSNSTTRWMLIAVVLVVVAVVAGALRNKKETKTDEPLASSTGVPSSTSSPPTVAPTRPTRGERLKSSSRGTQPADTPSPNIQLAEVGADRSNQESWARVDDPAADGWQTEAFHERIKRQLKRIGKVLSKPSALSSDELSTLIAAEFNGQPLVPPNLQTTISTPLLTVERAKVIAGDTPQYTGREGFVDAIANDYSFLKDARDVRSEFKVTRVEKSYHHDDITTRQLFSLAARTPQGMIEQHATWEARWQSAGDDSPRLLSITVSDFEQTTSNHAAGPLMSDCTQAALSGNASYVKQIARGANHWLERIPFRTMLNLFSMPGIAVGDANGDGLDDLYLCQDPGLPNRLFLQQSDGTLQDETEAWGVDWIEDARSALLVDLDNDGDQDLVVGIRAAVVVATNDMTDDGQRRFRLAAVLPTSEDVTSLCAADYDADGRLDIYACAYQPNELLRTSSGASMGAAMPQFVLHDANNGAANSLFRNNTAAGEKLSLVDVTKSLGLDTNNRRWSLAAAWEDYDNDGDLDLYVANDYGRDNLYRHDVNENGQHSFVDVGDDAHVESSAAGMAIAWGDYDRDGWMDAYISNMWSSAGHRVTTQPEFKPTATDEIRQRLQHFAAGNTLLHNRGDGTFASRAAAENVDMGRWAWGNGFLDIDNDGWEDLIVANGYMTTDDSGDL